MNPLSISIIIPVYNRERYINRAVQSCLRLDGVKEVLIVDDGSTDTTINICRELCHLDERVKLLHHPGSVNKGISASRNLGIKSAACDYIAFLDSDDYYLPHRFDAASLLLNGSTGIDGCYGSLLIKQENDLTDPVNPSGHLKPNGQRDNNENLLEALLTNKAYIHTNTVTVKKQLLVDAGLFDEDVHFGEDKILWMKLAWHGRLIAEDSDTPVAVHTVHDTNTESRMRHSDRLYMYGRLWDYFKNKKTGNKIKWQLLKSKAVYQNNPLRKNKLATAMSVFREICSHPSEVLYLFK